MSLISILRGARDRFAAAAARRTVPPRSAYVDKTTQVLGWRSIAIGEYAVISEGCWFNVNARQAKTIQLEIGRASFIGRRNVFNPGRLIQVGEFCLTGTDCQFVCSDHKFDDPFRPYVSTGNTLEGVIEIGANCWFGSHAAVVGSAKIGFGSIIGAASFVRGDIPPFSIAVGNPARVVKRYDALAKRWIPVAAFTPEMEAALPDENSYLQILRSKWPNPTLPVRAAGRSQGDLP